jgi:hypothetical protein
MNEKVTYLDYTLRKAWTQVPTLQTPDFSKPSHWSGYAPAILYLVWGRLAALPNGPPKPPNIAQAGPILNMV